MLFYLQPVPRMKLRPFKINVDKEYEFEDSLQQILIYSTKKLLSIDSKHSRKQVIIKFAKIKLHN